MFASVEFPNFFDTSNFPLSAQFAAKTQCEVVNEFNNAEHRQSHKQAQQSATACYEVGHCVRFGPNQRNEVVFLESHLHHTLISEETRRKMNFIVVYFKYMEVDTLHGTH